MAVVIPGRGGVRSRLRGRPGMTFRTYAVDATTNRGREMGAQVEATSAHEAIRVAGKLWRRGRGFGPGERVCNVFVVEMGADQIADARRRSIRGV